VRFSVSRWPVDFGVTRWPSCLSIICSSAKDIGAIVDPSGKAGHVRTVPVPDWVYSQLSEWMTAAGIETGRFSVV